VPQAPQLPLSVCVLTQTPGIVPHLVLVGAGHAPQTPAVHVAPVAHAVPQPPQFAGSVIVLTHAPPHTVIVQPAVSIGMAVSAIAVSSIAESAGGVPVSPGGAPVSSGGAVVSFAVESAAAVSSTEPVSLNSGPTASPSLPHPNPASAVASAAQNAALRKPTMGDLLACDPEADPAGGTVPPTAEFQAGADATDRPRHRILTSDLGSGEVCSESS